MCDSYECADIIISGHEAIIQITLLRMILSGNVGA